MKYIKVIEAANICGVTTQTIRNLCKSNTLRYRKRGCSFEVCIVDVERHAEKIKEVSEIESEIEDLIVKKKELRDSIIQENKLLKKKLHEMNILPKRLKLLCAIMSREVSLYRNYFTEKDYDEVQSILSGLHYLSAESSVIGADRQFERLESRVRRAMRSIQSEVDMMKVELGVRDKAIYELRKKNEDMIRKESGNESDYMLELLNTHIKDICMTVRLYNCLKVMEVETLGDACEYDKVDYLKTRNFGKKSLNELEEILESRGLTFGMNVKKYYREQV